MDARRRLMINLLRAAARPSAVAGWGGHGERLAGWTSRRSHSPESEVFALTAAGAEPDAAAALLRQLTAAAQAGRRYQHGQQIMATYQHEPWYPLLSAGGFTLDPATWAQLTAWAGYDPRDDLTRLTTPTLATYGENDPLVPVRASVERLRRPPAPCGNSRPSPGAAR